MIKLLVGLGNPGPEYEDTRHNAGFWWLDAIAQDLKAPFQVERSYHGLVAKTNFQGHQVWLLKPQTFMNVSGKSVGALARFFKIAPEDILVAHDELDIAPGEAKIKLGGGHAGHNGLRDIHAQLGTDQYWRLRIGIGHPGLKAEVVNWVLKKPAPDQRNAIEDCISRARTATPFFIGWRYGQSYAVGAHRKTTATQASSPRGCVIKRSLGFANVETSPIKFLAIPHVLDVWEYRPQGIPARIAARQSGPRTRCIYQD